MPFAIGWMGQNHRAIVPAVLYGAVMVMAALSQVIDALVALMWLIPDRRIERVLSD